MSPALTVHDGGSCTATDDPGEPLTGAPRVSVSEEESRWLAWMATASYVLEIGTGLGVSTRALATRAHRVVTVDNDPWVHAEVWPALMSLGNVDPAVEVPTGATFDMAFIDGDHRTDSVARDILAVCRVCHAESLIVLHDVRYPHVFEGVKRVCPIMVGFNTAHGLGFLWAKDVAG